jgi:hypothetical protein
MTDIPHRRPQTLPLCSLYEPFYHINVKCALYHTRCVLGGASREHVLAAVWKLLPTKPSPRERMQGGESLQAFTAARRIVDEVPYLSLIWCQRAAPPIALARRQGTLPSAGNLRGLPGPRPRVILPRLFVVSLLHRRGRRTHGMGSGGQRCRRVVLSVMMVEVGRVPAHSCQTCRRDLPFTGQSALQLGGSSSNGTPSMPPSMGSRFFWLYLPKLSMAAASVS